MPRTFRRHPFFPVVVLVSSLTLTFVATALVARAARYREQTSFEAAVSHTVQRIEGRMQVFIALLQGTAGLFAQAPVSRQEFADYVRRLRLDRDYVGLLGIGYSPVVTRNNRDDLIAAARAEGFTDFDFWPANPDTYMGVYYLEPLNALNRAALGFDMASDPIRRAAILRARDLDEPALTGRVTLQQTAEGRSGFILYVPLHRDDEFTGVVYCPFTIAEFISGIFAPEKDPRLAFAFYEDGALVHESLFGYADAGESRWHTERKLSLAGREWTIRFLALPAFLHPLERAVAPALGIGGVLLSVLLFGLARAQGQAKQALVESYEMRAMAMQQEEAARKEAEDTSAVLDSLFRATPAGLAVLDRQLRFVKLNQGLAEIHGIAMGQHIGSTMGELLPEVGAAVTQVCREVIATGEARVAEISGKTAKNEERTLLINVAAVRTHSGDIVGVAMVVLDITDRTRGEEERRQLIAALEEERETLEALNRIGKQIAAELDANRLVQSITDDATRLAGAQFGAFFYNVVGNEGESFMLYTISGVPRSRFGNLPMPRNTAIFGPTFSGERVVRIDDVRVHPDFGRNAPFNGLPEGHLPVVSYMAVPVVSRSGRVIGGLFFGHGEPGVFTERAEKLVSGLAAQAAIAMDNAQMFLDLQWMVKELERSNQDLDQFAYVASHDLKAPLRGIASLSEWIEEDLAGSMTDDSRRHLQLLRGRVSRLEALIDGILRYSRAGRKAEDVTDIDTRQVVDEVMALLAPSRDDAIVVTTAMPTLRAPRVPLQQIFLNFISNALKYGGGSCEVSATEAGAHWQFCISDHGPGIAPRYHERVWGIFQTLQPRDRVEGTGIGLAVVKKIVATHGGRVWLESDEGQGARFYFTWPKTTVA